MIGYDTVKMLAQLRDYHRDREEYWWGMCDEAETHRKVQNCTGRAGWHAAASKLCGELADRLMDQAAAECRESARRRLDEAEQRPASPADGRPVR